MFERFTDRARRVVVLAQTEARALKHNYIGTEHILLGLIHEGEGVAAKALASLGIGLEEVRQQVEEIIGRGQHEPSGHIPFTPRAKKVLELSLREALQLDCDYIGTEHILLGLIREGDGVAAQVLVRMGADLNRVRHQVIRLLRGREGEATGSRPRLGDLPEEVLMRRTISRERWVGEMQTALAKITERLDVIERHLGLAERPAAPHDPPGTKEGPADSPTPPGGTERRAGSPTPPGGTERRANPPTTPPGGTETGGEG